MLGFLAVWLGYPRLRPWIEAPKYRVLEWDRRLAGGGARRREVISERLRFAPFDFPV